jgi:drug/metabolite transporter (DMT)-like permease
LVGFIALVAANAMWGTSAAASKALLPHVPPFAMAVARVGIALVFLLLVAHLTGVRAATGRAPALLGFSGVVVFCGCQNVGLLYADASTTSLMYGAIPLMTAALAVPVLGERVSRRGMLGIGVSIPGLLWIVMPGGDVQAMVAPGNLLPLAAALGSAGYLVLGRRSFGGASGLAIVAGSTRYGLWMLLPFAAWELAEGRVQPVPPGDMLLILYLGIGCSALAYLLCGFGLARVEVSRGAMTTNLRPLVGVLVAATVLGEPIGVNLIAGGVLVLAGVWIGSAPPRRLSPQPLPDHVAR